MPEINATLRSGYYCSRCRQNMAVRSFLRSLLKIIHPNILTCSIRDKWLISRICNDLEISFKIGDDETFPYISFEALNTGSFDFFQNVSRNCHFVTHFDHPKKLRRKCLIVTNFFSTNKQHVKIKLMHNETNRWSIVLEKTKYWKTLI